MNVAKHAVWALLVSAAAASAQVTVWLENPESPEIPGLTVQVGETAVIQLWMEVPEGVIPVAVDAILRGSDAGSGQGLSFEVAGFNDYGPWGTFGRVDPRGQIGIPGGNISEYQFVGEEENLPYGAESGLATGTYLLDEIIVLGMADNTVAGPDTVVFASGTLAPEAYQLVRDPEAPLLLDRVVADLGHPQLFQVRLGLELVEVVVADD